MADRIHVVAAAICDQRGCVLIARRDPRSHQGGLWEFPGGKVEAGESPAQALVRELDEELGIRPLSTRPLIRVAHDYPDKRVLLDVWRVDAFAGEPHAREGQPLRWVQCDELSGHEFPAANRPIIAALQLPPLVLVTPAPPPGAAGQFIRTLDASIQRHGLRLVQLRAPQLPAGDYVDLARRVLEVCRARGAKLMLNAPPPVLDQVAADGIHLPGRELARLQRRPVGSVRLSAACHDREQIEAARRLPVDFVYLSPVKPTPGHPQARPLGWQGFAELAAGAGVPVYALGGLDAADLAQAREHGAQGVAAMRALWVSDTAAG